MIEEGESVPKFTINDAEGNKVKSTDFKGKKHVIYFYPKDFTPGCSTQADEFSINYKKFQDNGIEIIGISPDDTSSHKKFCIKMGIKYTLLSDIEKEVSKAFGVWGMKKFMGREYHGIYRTTFIINKKGIIEDIIEKVNTKQHINQILK